MPLSNNAMHGEIAAGKCAKEKKERMLDCFVSFVLF